MILEKIIKRYMMRCDKCGTSYCDAAGPYFTDKDKMVQDAISSGWKIDHYTMSCPDCSKETNVKTN